MGEVEVYICYKNMNQSEKVNQEKAFGVLSNVYYLRT